MSDVTGEKKGKLNKAKFWKNNNLTKLEKTVDKKKQIRDIEVEMGTKTANNALKYNNSKKEKGALSRIKKIKDQYNNGVFNSLPSEKKKEFLKAESNLAKMRKETRYGKTKKSNERNEIKLKMAKLAGNTKGKIRSRDNILNKLNTFQDRKAQLNIIANNTIKKEAYQNKDMKIYGKASEFRKTLPNSLTKQQKNKIVAEQYKVFEHELINNIPNEKRASIVSNLTNNYLRGSNKLGFKKRKRANAVNRAKRR